MVALISDRNTPRQQGTLLEVPVKGATTIFAGALVCLNGTVAVPGAVSTTLIALGRAEEQKINTGADGAVTVRVRRGVFRYANSASADAISWADYGKQVFVVDDQTVAKTNGTNTRSVAGICRGVDAQGVWVEF
jgi:hypothetical protein